MATILVVDDDPSILRILRRAIGADGHVVLTAANTEEAEPLLARHPALILADIDMPGETGVEMVVRLRRRPELEAIPVVFLTAYPERARPLQATGRGALRVIPKPFKLSELRDLVQNLAGAHGEAEWRVEGGRR